MPAVLVENRSYEGSKNSKNLKFYGEKPEWSFVCKLPNVLVHFLQVYSTVGSIKPVFLVSVVWTCT